MKRLILALATSVALGWSCFCARAELQWYTDAGAAQQRAQLENKAILLDFTGSDWCGWCMKLKAEIFDQPEFERFAAANLVLVEVDFPRHKQLDANLQSQNERLASMFHIKGYPTIVVLDQNGNALGETGYTPGGPQAFNETISRILKSGTRTPTTVTADPSKPRKPVVMPTYAPPVTNYYGKLALKGISGTKDRRIVQINNATLMVGESAHVKVQDNDVVVCCKEIRENGSVLITVDDVPVELKLGQR